MKFGVLRNIAGNIEALKDADRQFDEFGVDTKVCLGQIIGLYPYVDDCIEFLINQRYVTLQMLVEKEFVNGCHFVGWSLIYLVEAARFARSVVSRQSLEYLGGLPLRQEMHDVAFESRAETGDGSVFKPDQADAAFASWKHQVVIHAGHCDPHVWREDLTGAYLSTGRNMLPADGRLLISTGGLGCSYMGSTDTKQPAAIVFDDADRTVHLLRPMCDVRKIFDRLRQTDYPQNVLRYLEGNEYEVWRTVGA